MAKGKTPLYLSYIDTINGLLNSIKFSAELPVHKKSIDRSGRNVEWLRKGIKRGKLTIPGVDIGNEFWKLAQLLEVEAPAYGNVSALGMVQTVHVKIGETVTLNAEGWSPSSIEQRESRMDRKQPEVQEEVHPVDLALRGSTPNRARQISKNRNFAENYGTNADVTDSTKTLDKYETR
ncbi:hypothetical protein Lauda_00210 [Pseudomonas phage vB_PpuM-Lauda]